MDPRLRRVPYVGRAQYDGGFRRIVRLFSSSDGLRSVLPNRTFPSGRKIERGIVSHGYVIRDV